MQRPLQRRKTQAEKQNPIQRDPILPESDVSSLEPGSCFIPEESEFGLGQTPKASDPNERCCQSSGLEELLEDSESERSLTGPSRSGGSLALRPVDGQQPLQ